MRILRLLWLAILVIGSIQLAIAQDDDREDDALEKALEKKEKEMEKMLQSFESVFEKAEDNDTEIDTAIAPTPANFTAFRKLVDKTVMGLENSLPKEIVTEARFIRDHLQSSGKIGEVSIISMLKENMFSSVLLAGYAVQADYGDIDAIGCFGGILNICGHPSKSIPILEYSASANPNLNTFSNLGDAYRRMGDLNKAKSWLKKAVAIEPYEIDANLLLGQIAMKNGQKTQAADYFTSSLQGGYTAAAESYLKKLKKDLNEEVDIGEILLKTHTREPLNEVLQITCPEMPTDVESIKNIWLPGLKGRIESIKKYIESLQTKTAGNTESMIMDLISKMDNRQVEHPENLSVSCTKSYLITQTLYKMLNDTIRAKYDDYAEQKAKLDIALKKSMGDLHKSHEEALKSCTGSNDWVKCQEKTDATYCALAKPLLADYLNSYSAAYEKLCAASFSSLTEYYNTGMKWAYTAFLPAQREFGLQSTIYMPIAGWVLEITETAKDLTHVDLYSNAGFCHPDEISESPPVRTNSKILPTFPGDQICTSIQVPLFVGSFQIDCRGYSLEIGLGDVIVDGLPSISIARESDAPTDAVESIFPETSRTTIKIGMGLPTSVAGTGFKFDKSYFATVDDNMSVSDYGMLHETGLQAGGLAVGQQYGLKIGATSGGTFIDSNEPEKKLFSWKDVTE